jgi:hypothetical protein
MNIRKIILSEIENFDWIRDVQEDVPIKGTAWEIFGVRGHQMEVQNYLFGKGFKWSGGGDDYIEPGEDYLIDSISSVHKKDIEDGTITFATNDDGVSSINDTIRIITRYDKENFVKELYVYNWDGTKPVFDRIIPIRN